MSGRWMVVFFTFIVSVAVYGFQPAEKVQSESLENFYKVSESVYRSAQPDEIGFEELIKMGFTDVLNLREYHSDDDEADDLGLNLHRVKMNAGNILEDDVVAALKIIKNAKGKVLVHCWHGSDRTGTVIAMYRIIFQNVSREEALHELVNGGFGFHSIYKNIPEFIKNCNVEKIRTDVFGE